MWGKIQGHDDIVERFRRAFARGRLASSFLFVGPGGVGKRLFAKQLAKGVLCGQVPDPVDFCDDCPDCRQVDSNTHPDFQTVTKPDGKSTIPLELLVGDRQHRMRSGLCYDISLKPMRGGRRVAVIADADYLNVEGANALLKTLEEPPPKSILILISESEQRQLPTIRSRCQTIRFQPLADKTIAEILLENSLIDDADEANVLASLAGGGMDRAMRLMDAEIREFRVRMIAQLGERDPRSNQFIESLLEVVDSAGKDASARRDRLREILAFAIDFFQQWMRSQVGAQVTGDDALKQAFTSNDEGSISPETAAWLIARSIQAEEQVFANANLTNVAECWFDDVAETLIHRRPPALADLV